MMKEVNIGDRVWYKIMSDDIRNGQIQIIAPNVNGRVMYKVSGCDFWFVKEQLFATREEIEKEK